MRPSETFLLEITEFMPSYEDFLFVRVFHISVESKQISLHCRKECFFGSDISVELQLCIAYKVKVSHSLIAVGAVGVRVPLYLGHS